MALPSSAVTYNGPGPHPHGVLWQLPSGIYCWAQADAEGNLKVNLAAGSVVVNPGVITSATPNDPIQAALTNTAAQALPANSARLWVIIQNFGGEPLYYLFGSVAQVGAASATNCTGFLLAGAPPLILDGAQVFTGVIQWVSTATGTTGNIQDGDA